MFIEIDPNSKEIRSITGDNIPKDDPIYSTCQCFTWTDKELDGSKLKEGYTAFYDKETDEIYYEIKSQEPILTETEEAILNTNMNVEFLVAMQEMTI